MIHKNKIREFRESAGLSQIELSAKSGIGQATLCKAERGWIKISDESVRKLTKALKCNESDLFEESAIKEF